MKGTENEIGEDKCEKVSGSDKAQKRQEDGETCRGSISILTSATLNQR